METKVREYKYDNLKFLMIFFVVFAHCLEIMKDEGIPHYLYVFIYTFHMPIFIFISGYFAKGTKESIMKFLGIYIVYQIAYCIFDKFILLQETNLRFFKPFWIMWYMFAICAWSILINFFNTKSQKKGLILFLITIFISIIAGFCNKIEYEFSLSRIITFFPFFLLGYYSKNLDINIVSIKDKEEKINKLKLFFLIIGMIVTGMYFIKNIENIQGNWLYGAYPYSSIGYSFVFKIMWFILSVCELMIFNAIITSKKIKLISYIGTNTLTIYLLHGFFIKFMKIKLNIFVFDEIKNILIAFCISIIIVVVLGNNYVKKIFNFTLCLDKLMYKLSKMFKERVCEFIKK